MNEEKVEHEEKVEEQKTEKEDIKMKTVKIEGMSCMHCVGRVQKALEALEGTVSVSVELNSGLAKYEGSASDEAIKSAVEDAGYEVTEIK